MQEASVTGLTWKQKTMVSQELLRVVKAWRRNFKYLANSTKPSKESKIITKCRLSSLLYSIGWKCFKVCKNCNTSITFWLFSHVRDHFLWNVNNGNSLIKTEREKWKMVPFHIRHFQSSFRAPRALSLEGVASTAPARWCWVIETSRKAEEKSCKDKIPLFFRIWMWGQKSRPCLFLHMPH